MTETTHEALVRQTGAAEELLDYFQGSRADIDARVAVKEAQVDAFLSGATGAIGAYGLISFDPSISRSKAAMIGDNTLTVDAAAPYQTEWYSTVTESLLPYTYLYSTGGDERAFVQMSRNNQGSNGGVNDDPPYSSDYCITRMECILASAYATNAQINQWFVDNPDHVSPRLLAHNGNTAFSKEIPIVRVPGEHPYLCVFIRFRNEVSSAAIAANQATEVSPIQNIDTNGSNFVFAMNQVVRHPF